MNGRAPRFFANITRKMDAAGMAEPAAELRHEFAGRLGPLPPSFAQPQVWGGGPAKQPAPRLPAACPQCNAPLRSNEVDWIDAISAGCPYCGSTLRAM
jgi:hypothetical protein